MEDLMKLFKVKAYKSCAAMKLRHKQEAKEAEIALHEAENHLDSSMGATMEATSAEPLNW
ncbi:hypothetical protein TIFTF001_032190 [Ficus carica]|uniref:Uncharacterized protein n=1 Tax=Ficus carica TaxID=3494 RepID=A0AA88J672_FICCA|nr:hypothetical protein TIFTF001_032190 [Ficus carica]